MIAGEREGPRIRELKVIPLAGGLVADFPAMQFNDVLDKVEAVSGARLGSGVFPPEPL